MYRVWRSSAETIVGRPRQSFSAIADGPEPEVAEAGHDRAIINVQPKHVDAWLNPNAAELGVPRAIFDDNRHPFASAGLQREGCRPFEVGSSETPTTFCR